MTTPENAPEPGRENNPPPAGAPGTPNPYGSPQPGGGTRPEPQYGQYASGPYGYQAAQPSGYAYPGGGMGKRAPKGPAPREVVIGSWLILAAGVLSLINNIITSFNLPSLLTPEEQQTLTDSGMTPTSVNSFLVSFGIVVALIGFGFYILIAVFVRRGKNWARILGTVFAAFALIGIITMAATYFTSPLGLLSLLSSLLGIAGIVMLYLTPSNPYFRTTPLYPPY
ncbi:hypothetical protein [Arthrobacter sp. zg-Y1143]|uniref:hypothetical protein n=1 Tax=Arthrobacter sp. zg-Y1143 TaxID=3049065 RepID=UPI0024C4563F|nr:hypothetical protein [Arthrobacter sp. zg-Y1143]MDK1326780.1 hypothetical protein [Arthrobacter sp. zg-Y1143]